MSDEELVRRLRLREGHSYVLVMEDGLFTVIRLTNPPEIQSKHVVAAATSNCPREALASVVG